MHWTEVAGFITGALCVWLIVRRNIWNFPVGLANNTFFFILFMRAGLYGESVLQIFYFILGCLGWYWWLRGGENRTELPISRTPGWAWPVLITGVVVMTTVFYLMLDNWTDSTVPLPDGFTTAMSLTAQLMVNRKWIGNWIFWITADLTYIWLYAYKGLYLTSVLYVLFLTMCVIGLRQWISEYRQTQNNQIPVEVAS